MNIGIEENTVVDGCVRPTQDSSHHQGVGHRRWLVLEQQILELQTALASQVLENTVLKAKVNVLTEALQWVGVGGEEGHPETMMPRSGGGSRSSALCGEKNECAKVSPSPPPPHEENFIAIDTDKNSNNNAKNNTNAAVIIAPQSRVPCNPRHLYTVTPDLISVLKAVNVKLAETCTTATAWSRKCKKKGKKLDAA